jgi:hypothetical protein
VRVFAEAAIQIQEFSIYFFLIYNCKFWIKLHGVGVGISMLGHMKETVNYISISIITGK